MNTIAKRNDKSDIQQEFLNLVNDGIIQKNLNMSDVADYLGVDKGWMSRTLRGQRKLTYADVVQLSQLLEIMPPPLNSIGKPEPESRFLPLIGNIAATIWRVKGSAMPEILSPIRPVDTGSGEEKEQNCYFVNEGPHSGQYVVCVNLPNGYEIEDGDIVVVEETRLLPPANLEMIRFSLKVVKCTGPDKVLVDLDGDGTDAEISYVAPGIELKGLVIGFFISVR